MIRRGRVHAKPIDFVRAFAIAGGLLVVLTTLSVLDSAAAQ